MNEPKISVIVPIYNAAEYIVATVSSLLSVKDVTLEVILVDDGSTDGSGEIIDSINDTRVRVIHKENGGASSARNAGIEAARGEWLAFVDADDLVLPDIYSYLLDGTGGHLADIVQCAAYLEAGEKRTVINTDGATRFAAPENFKNSFFKSFSNANWAKIYRSRVFKNLRFDTAYTIGEDLRYNLDALRLSTGTLLLPQPKYRYIQREESLCNAAPTERRLRSFYDMALTAEADFSDNKVLYDFIFSERILATLDSLSKIATAKDASLVALESELRGSLRRSLFKALASALIPLKEKCKLLICTLLPAIYRRLVLRGKK